MKTFIIYLATAIFFMACQSENASFDSSETTEEIQNAPAMAEAKDQAVDQRGQADDSGEEVEVLKQPAKIIKEARIKFEVEDYYGSKHRIDSLVWRWGGYISGEDEQHSNYQIYNTIIIRVSSKNFEDLIADLGSLKGRITAKNINAWDVTEEFVDLETRIKTKKEVEKRYYELLKRANKIEDILSVENEIRKIREEIEAKEGRLKYLNDRIAYSTITLELFERFEYKYEPDPEPGFFERLIKALDIGWKGLLSFIIGLVYLWPLLLIFGIAFYLFRRYRSNKKKKA